MPSRRSSRPSGQTCSGLGPRCRSPGSRLERAREARQAAESALRISQVRYRNGTSPAIETLLAEQQLDQARLSEVAAVTEYNVAQVRLRTQLGPVAPGDLSGPSGSATE